MKLWIIRHAKSSWSKPGLSDFDRPLNNRGTRDGATMADWLARQSHPAEWIWTSTAARAQATAEFIRQGFDLPRDVVVPTDELYHASPDDLLEVIRQTPTDVESVVLVAHNPGMTSLVNRLGPEPVTENLPTFGVARFDCSVPWQSIQPGGATLDLLVSPKRLPS